MSGFAWGAKSRAKLDTCHPDLVLVMDTFIKDAAVDCIIVCGGRGYALQEEAFRSGASKVRFPDSNHNVGDGSPRMLSDAVDFAPWIGGTIDWKDDGSFRVMAGAILHVASKLGIKLRWGGDWDKDGLTRDQTFQDIGHIERVP